MEDSAKKSLRDDLHMFNGNNTTILTQTGSDGKLF